ncbi:acyl-protein thioesterase-1-like protein [Xylaria palmicola]|nr:acyl-protein thioesterase-1-like protein [Xylaria palmicola]
MISAFRVILEASLSIRFLCLVIFIAVFLSRTPTCSADPIFSDPTKMAMARAKPLLIAASAKHTATVIFLHGLGDTGFGWASAVESWTRRSQLDEVKWVLPHAPRIPITAAEGMSLPGWFDVSALNGAVDDIRANQDEPGLLRTRDYVNTLIQAEIDAGIPANRIVLGGFSQGGAMALLTGLTAKVKLAGIVGLSCWVPLDSKIPSLIQESNNNQDTPIFMAHGTVDQVVPTAFGKLSYELLKKLNFPATMKLYPNMPHSACDEELDEVEAFLHSRLPPQEEQKSEL